MTFPDQNRRDNAAKQRNRATQLSTEVDHPQPEPNRDEKAPYIFSFTKGMAHDQNGLLSDTADFEAFRAGTQDHDPATFAQARPYRGAFGDTDTSALGTLKVYRRWESPTAGHAYVLEGPDPFAVQMPPAPEAGSAEFAAEMAEVYQMALHRNVGVAAFMDKALIDGLTKADGTDVSKACKDRIVDDNADAVKAAKCLAKMRWFAGEADDNQPDHIKTRRRHGATVTPATMYRGLGEDAWATPFLSQFMVMGSGGANKDERTQNRAKGMIQYGAQKIAQMVRVAQPEKDYMTSWEDWLHVQNGLNARALLPMNGSDAEFMADAYRPMARLRDLATYVHDDQLYQAYFNAALILLDEKFEVDEGIPYHGNARNKFPFAGAMDDDTNQSPFALFGGPHLLTLVTEVSSRALKAVRGQKFSIHRRMRPEAAGALFHTVYSEYQPDWDLEGSTPMAIGDMSKEANARAQLARTIAAYTFPQDPDVKGSEPALEDILTKVRLHNKEQNKGKEGAPLKNSWLLPMAFAEGSPMHPAYGAGHATVAGACVTLLKAFFAMKKKDGTPVYVVERGDIAFVPDCGTSPQDKTIDLLAVKMDKGLTLEGELNKLMWNISNGRNVAGVHYYTDYIESALLGEAITLGILREQMMCYHPDEQVNMTVPLVTARHLPECLLNGSTIRPDELVREVCILPDGTLKKVR